MDNSNNLTNRVPASAGEFRIPDTTGEIDLEFDQIIKGEFPSLSEQATSFAISSQVLGSELQLDRQPAQATPEAVVDNSPLHEYHMVSHAMAVMRNQGVLREIDKYNFIPKTFTKALGTLGIIGSNTKDIEAKLLQDEGHLSEQLFMNKPVTPPENEIWQFLHIEGDWYWTRTYKGQNQAYKVTHFFPSKDGSHIQMIESVTDKNQTLPSYQGVVEDMQGFMNEYVKPYMELAERHLYAAPKALHAMPKGRHSSKPRKH